MQVYSENVNLLKVYQGFPLSRYFQLSYHNTINSPSSVASNEIKVFNSLILWEEGNMTIPLTKIFQTKVCISLNFPIIKNINAQIQVLEEHNVLSYLSTFPVYRNTMCILIKKTMKIGGGLKCSSQQQSTGMRQQLCL